MHYLTALCQAIRDWLRAHLDGWKPLTVETADELRRKLDDQPETIDLPPRLSHTVPTLPLSDDSPSILPMVRSTCVAPIQTGYGHHTLSLSEQIALESAAEICDVIRAKNPPAVPAIPAPHEASATRGRSTYQLQGEGQP